MLVVYLMPERALEAMAVFLFIVSMLVSCLMLRVALETISVYWFAPRRIRQFMERQGVRGPRPRFLVGNLFHMASFVQKTTSSDMGSIHHDIVGRLLPHYVLWSKLYGKKDHNQTVESITGVENFLFSVICQQNNSIP